MRTTVRRQTVATLRDLREEHEPRRWVIPPTRYDRASSFGWVKEQSRLALACLLAAQAVMAWREDEAEESEEPVAFARQVAVADKGPNWSLIGADCTFVITMEPIPAGVGQTGDDSGAGARAPRG